MKEDDSMDMNSFIQNIERMPNGLEKSEKIETLFHITFWRHLSLENKLQLFQLLENDLSYKEARAPSKIVSILKQPYLACAPVERNIIRVSEHQVTFGVDYLEEMNAQCYNAIIHEHEHISQYLCTLKPINDPKREAYKMNFDYFFPPSTSVLEYTRYMFQPIERDAYQMAAQKTQEIFKKLTKQYGPDEGYTSWKKASDLLQLEKLIEYYNSYYRTNATVETFYEETMELIRKHYNQSIEIKHRSL